MSNDYLQGYIDALQLVKTLNTPSTNITNKELGAFKRFVTLQVLDTLREHDPNDLIDCLTFYEKCYKELEKSTKYKYVQIIRHKKSGDTSARKALFQIMTSAIKTEINNVITKHLLTYETSK